MRRPQEYFIEYVDPKRVQEEAAHVGGFDKVDFRLCTRTLDFGDEVSARHAATVLAKMGRVPLILRRVDMVDVTPMEDGQGLIFDWDDELVTDEYVGQSSTEAILRGLGVLRE